MQERAHATQKSLKTNEPNNKHKSNNATVSNKFHKKEPPQNIKNFQNKNKNTNTNKFIDKIEDSKRYLNLTPSPPANNASISNTNPSITSNCNRDGIASANSD